MYDSWNGSTGGREVAVSVANADHLIDQFLRKRGYVLESLRAEEIDTSPAQKRAKTTKKRVRFSPTLMSQTFRSSDSDVQGSWYQRHDYFGFMEDCRSLVLRTESNGGQMLRESEDSSSFCIRGLEDHLTPGLYIVKRERKKSLIRMIVHHHRIFTNDPQGPGGVTDVQEHLRSISSVFSSQSRKWAHEMALIDEKNR